jgi:hypothetical protein
MPSMLIPISALFNPGASPHGPLPRMLALLGPFRQQLLLQGLFFMGHVSPALAAMAQYTSASTIMVATLLQLMT